METLKYPTEVRARKKHYCDFCAETINITEIHLVSTHKFDGRVYDFRTHKYCQELASKLKMYDYADEGVNQEFFMETISHEHDDLLIGLLPEGEALKYSDIIRQLRNVKWREKLWYVIRHYNKKQIATENNIASTGA